MLRFLPHLLDPTDAVGLLLEGRRDAHLSGSSARHKARVLHYIAGHTHGILQELTRQGRAGAGQGRAGVGQGRVEQKWAKTCRGKAAES